MKRDVHRFHMLNHMTRQNTSSSPEAHQLQIIFTFTGNLGWIHETEFLAELIFFPKNTFSITHCDLGWPSTSCALQWKVVWNGPYFLPFNHRSLDMPWRWWHCGPRAKPHGVKYSQYMCSTDARLQDCGFNDTNRLARLTRQPGGLLKSPDSETGFQWNEECMMASHFEPSFNVHYLQHMFFFKLMCLCWSRGM